MLFYTSPLRSRFIVRQGYSLVYKQTLPVCLSRLNNRHSPRISVAVTVGAGAWYLIPSLLLSLSLVFIQTSVPRFTQVLFVSRFTQIRVSRFLDRYCSSYCCALSRL